MKKQYVIMLMFLRGNDIQVHNHIGATEILKSVDNKWKGEEEILDLVLKEKSSLKRQKEGYALVSYSFVVLPGIDSVGCMP